jgi:hypothetical protein
LGRSKEGTWTPQVIEAQAVIREGNPVRSWVLPGTNELRPTGRKLARDYGKYLKGTQLNQLKLPFANHQVSYDRRFEG